MKILGSKKVKKKKKLKDQVDQSLDSRYTPHIKKKIGGKKGSKIPVCVVYIIMKVEILF